MIICKNKINIIQMSSAMKKCPFMKFLSLYLNLLTFGLSRQLIALLGRSLQLRFDFLNKTAVGKKPEKKSGTLKPPGFFFPTT